MMRTIPEERVNDLFSIRIGTVFQFGVFTTAWDQVPSIRSDKPVNVLLPDGRTVQGTIATANGRVEVATRDATLSLAPAEVGTISKWLIWNVGLSDRYLNHTAPGRTTNDYLYITGLGITFAK